jgi:hypothetical protein
MKTMVLEGPKTESLQCRVSDKPGCVLNGDGVEKQHRRAVVRKEEQRNNRKSGRWAKMNLGKLEKTTSVQGNPEPGKI